MTLPSSRRPPEVEALLKEEAEGKRFLIRINRVECFMDEMIHWYKNCLNKRQKLELTKKRIIRRAMNAAYRAGLDYQSLPKYWLRNLSSRCGIVLKLSSRRNKYLPISALPAKPGSTDGLGGGCDGGGITGKGMAPVVAKMKDERILDQKMIDLTQEPPPKDWLRAYLQGQAQPRKLKTHVNAEGVSIIFYDYEQLDEQGCSKALETNAFRSPYDLDHVFPGI